HQAGDTVEAEQLPVGDTQEALAQLVLRLVALEEADQLLDELVLASELVVDFFQRALGWHEGTGLLPQSLAGRHQEGIDVCVRVRKTEKPGLELGRRQVDAAVEHGVEEAAVASAVGLLRRGEV